MIHNEYRTGDGKGISFFLAVFFTRHQKETFALYLMKYTTKEGEAKYVWNALMTSSAMQC